MPKKCSETLTLMSIKLLNLRQSLLSYLAYREVNLTKYKLLVMIMK